MNGAFTQHPVDDHHASRSAGGFHSTNNGGAPAASQWPISARRVSIARRSQSAVDRLGEATLRHPAGEQRAGLRQPILPPADAAAARRAARRAPTDAARVSHVSRRNHAPAAGGRRSRCRRGHAPRGDVDGDAAPGGTARRAASAPLGSSGRARSRPRHRTGATERAEPPASGGRRRRTTRSGTG